MSTGSAFSQAENRDVDLAPSACNWRMAAGRYRQRLLIGPSAFLTQHERQQRRGSLPEPCRPTNVMVGDFHEA